MLKLALRYNIVGLIVVAFILLGCRKEVNHELGTTVSNETSGWKRISSSAVEDLYALEVYQNRLYLAGNFESSIASAGLLLSFVASDTSFFVTNIGSKLEDGGIYDMILTDDGLYLGGDFHFSSSNGFLTSLYRHNNAVTSTDLDFAEYNPVTIYHLASYGDSIFVGGDFDYNSAFSPNINTKNAEFLQFDFPIGAADVDHAIHGSCMYNNELYVCGTQGFFGYYSGSSFFTIDYPAKSSSDVVYDITVIGNEIYLLGQFQGNEIMKVFNTSTGNWRVISEITKSENLAHGARFRWIQNELYVCGNGLQDNSDNITNLFKSSNGNNWKPFGTITVPVRDIELYEGTYYAACSNGLYRLND